VKIASVTANNRKRVFEVTTERGVLPLPYAKVRPQPTRSDALVDVYVDDELGQEGFTYHLASGAEGAVHVDSVLEYNRDPTYMRDMLLHRLTAEARDCLKGCGLSKREIIRRLGTSPAQLYRLLDPTNYNKSVDSMLSLLQVLDCRVEFEVHAPTSSR